MTLGMVFSVKLEDRTNPVLHPAVLGPHYDLFTFDLSSPTLVQEGPRESVPLLCLQQHWGADTVPSSRTRAAHGPPGVSAAATHRRAMEWQQTRCFCGSNFRLVFEFDLSRLNKPNLRKKHDHIGTKKAVT